MELPQAPAPAPITIWDPSYDSIKRPQGNSPLDSLPFNASIRNALHPDCVLEENSAQPRYKIIRRLARLYEHIADESDFQQRIYTPFVDSHLVKLTEEQEQYIIENSPSTRRNPSDYEVLFQYKSLRQIVGPDKWAEQSHIKALRAAQDDKNSRGLPMTEFEPKARPLETMEPLRVALDLDTASVSLPNSRALHLRLQPEERDTINDVANPPSHPRVVKAQSDSKARSTGHRSQKEGGHIPDVNIFCLWVVTAIAIVTGIFELKWVPPLKDAVDDHITRFRHKDRSTNLPSTAMMWAIRECVYQTLWYLFCAGRICSTPLAVAQTNEFFYRCFRIDNSGLLLLECDEAVSKIQTGPTQGGTARSPLTVDDMDTLDELWMPPHSLLRLDAKANLVTDEHALDLLSVMVYSAFFNAAQPPDDGHMDPITPSRNTISVAHQDSDLVGIHGARERAAKNKHKALSRLPRPTGSLMTTDLGDSSNRPDQDDQGGSHQGDKGGGEGPGEGHQGGGGNGQDDGPNEFSGEHGPGGMQDRDIVCLERESDGSADGGEEESLDDDDDEVRRLERLRVLLGPVRVVLVSPAEMDLFLGLYHLTLPEECLKDAPSDLMDYLLPLSPTSRSDTDSAHSEELGTPEQSPPKKIVGSHRDDHPALNPGLDSQSKIEGGVATMSSRLVT